MNKVTFSTKIDLLYNYVEKLHNIFEFLFNTIIVNGFCKIASFSLSMSDFFFSSKLTESQEEQSIKIDNIAKTILSLPETATIATIPSSPTHHPIQSSLQPLQSSSAIGHTSNRKTKPTRRLPFTPTEVVNALLYVCKTLNWEMRQHARSLLSNLKIIVEQNGCMNVLRFILEIDDSAALVNAIFTDNALIISNMKRKILFNGYFRVMGINQLFNQDRSTNSRRFERDLKRLADFIGIQNEQFAAFKSHLPEQSVDYQNFIKYILRFPKFQNVAISKATRDCDQLIAKIQESFCQPN